MPDELSQEKPEPEEQALESWLVEEFPLDGFGPLTPEQARAGKYGRIDVSMYPLDHPAMRRLNNAVTDEETEAALLDLPLAMVELNPNYAGNSRL